MNERMNGRMNEWLSEGEREGLACRPGGDAIHARNPDPPGHSQQSPSALREKRS